MYHCWKEHHIKPSDFYNMNEGEKVVLTAFYLQEMEELKEKYEAVSKAGCPAMAFI